MQQSENAAVGKTKRNCPLLLPVNLFVHCAREKRITRKIYMLFAN